MTEEEEERHALQVAIQEVVREFHGSVIIGCAVTLEVLTPSGDRNLFFRTFDTDGDQLLTWAAEGPLRAHLRTLDEQSRNDYCRGGDDDDPE